MAANPFSDLIPNNPPTSLAANNPFTDLVPINTNSVNGTQTKPIPNSGDFWKSVLSSTVNQMMSPLKKGINLTRDVAVGAGNAGQNIATTLTRGYAPTVNFEEMIGPKNPTLTDKTIQDLAQYSPLLAAGPMGLLADTAIGATYGATQSPESPIFGAGIGGGSNLGLGLLNKLTATSSPIVRALARAGIGGAIGGAIGGKEGAITGAGAGVALPTIATKLGYGYKEPGLELLRNIKPEETMARAEAANAIGTPLSPGEAAARPDVTAIERSYGRVGEAAADRVKIGQQRILEQKKAIQDLYGKVSPEDKIVSFDIRKAANNAIEKMKNERQDAVEGLYENSYNDLADPKRVLLLENKSKTIKNAIDAALADPVYSEELAGYPRNSIKVLDYAKRKIDAQIAQAQKFEDYNAVRALTQTKNNFLNAIDNFSNTYKKARDVYNELSGPIDEVEQSQLGAVSRLTDRNLKNVSKVIFDPSQTDIKTLHKIKEHVQSQDPAAWDSIVRNEMQRIMITGKNRGGTGVDFFNKVLSNDVRYKQFEAALDHNPIALEQLRNMKKAWENLINIETPKTAAGQSASGVNKSRNWMDALIDQWHEMIGGERQSQALKFMYSPKWQKKFDEIGRIKNRNARATLLGTQISKTIAPITFLENEKGHE